jgi:hypothetical protein
MTFFDTVFINYKNVRSHMMCIHMLLIIIILFVIFIHSLMVSQDKLVYVAYCYIKNTELTHSD